MSWYDRLNPFKVLGAIGPSGPIGQNIADQFNGPDLGKADLPYFEEDRQRLMDMLGGRSPWLDGVSTVNAPDVGSDPYGGQWGALIQQLQGQVQGTGPSLAVQQYQRAQGDATSQQLAMSRGSRSAGAGRQAAQNMGAVQQGLASGSAMARTQEQMASAGQLSGALQGAGQAAFGRDALRAQLGMQAGMFNATAQNQMNAQNQAAYLQLLGAQLGLSVEQMHALLGQMQIKSGQKTGLDRLLGVAAGAGALAGGGGGGA